MGNRLETWTAHLLSRLRLVQENLGVRTVVADDPCTRFADVLDSMGLVEFLAILAEDCGVTPATIERCVDQRFASVAELARALATTGLEPGRAAGCDGKTASPPTVPALQSSEAPLEAALPAQTCPWLAATVGRLPLTVQPATAINEALQQPAGWLQSHAGIYERRIWAADDPLEAAVQAGRECLDRAGILVDEVGALLVTSEAPPLLTGLAAALHHRLDLRPSTVALEIGGACTGFLATLWLGQTLLARVGVALVLCLEAPTRLLHLRPGAAGEAAALFGDAAAACVLCSHATGQNAVPLLDIELGADGKEGPLIQAESTTAGQLQLRLEGVRLASRAVRLMGQSICDLVQRNELALGDLTAVVAHGGNGRMPAMLARRLGLRSAQIWSETATTGNLGSASLPVAWAAQMPPPRTPVVWTAVGAGLTWGTALTGSRVVQKGSR